MVVPAYRWTVVVALTLAAGSPQLAATLDPAVALDAYTRKAVEEWEVPGLAVAVVHEGRVAFSRGYGVRELGERDPVDEHTLFAIGSTTKALTAASVALQVDAGRLTWDDRVQEILPWFRLADPWASRELTIRDLLTHRAGLGNADFLWYGSGRSRREILEKLALVEPAYSMRDGFVYQNILYVAAGEVAAAVAGEPWEELVTRELLAPLGMDRTFVGLSRAATQSNVARPHDLVGDQLVAIENASVDSVAPAGAVWSSVRDMSRWLRMLLARGEWGDGAVLSREAVAEILRPQTLLDLSQLYPYVPSLDPHWTSYSLGWFQLDYRGHPVSFHTGSIDGMSAIAGLVPDRDLGVVVLANRDHAELRHALLWKVVDLWTDGPDRDWSTELRTFYEERRRDAEAQRAARAAERLAGTSPSLSLDRYSGVYSDPVYDAVEVSLRDGRLALRLGPTLGGTLEHWHLDTFLLTFDRPWRGDALVTFALGPDGEPDTIALMGLSFTRQRPTRD